jgi:PAS domain S-box-containing protein
MILLDIEDITGRSEIGRAPSASEIQFRQLFESAKDGILILDADTGAIVEANPFLLDLLGYSHAELLGMHLWPIGVLGDVDASRASFGNCREVCPDEDRPLEPGTDSTSKWSCQRLSRQQPHDHQCNIRDVTERKRARRN